MIQDAAHSVLCHHGTVGCWHVQKSAIKLLPSVSGNWRFMYWHVIWKAHPILTLMLIPSKREDRKHHQQTYCSQQVPIPQKV